MSDKHLLLAQLDAIQFTVLQEIARLKRLVQEPDADPARRRASPLDGLDAALDAAMAWESPNPGIEFQD